MNKRKISAFLIIALVLTNNSFATFAQYLNRINPFEKVSAAEKSISNFQPHNERTNAVEIPIAEDITEGTNASWEGWYKNFIVDLSAVRFRFFDGNGTKVREEICLPSQYSGSSFSFENIYIKGIKDIILQDTIPYTISLIGFKFSDNIPFFRILDTTESAFKEESEDYALADILKTDFTKISNPKLFNEWIDEENGINLDKLDKEVGFNLLDKEGKNISVSEWLKSGEDGKLNSITIEPIAFFPGSTEEIYESNKKCSEEYNMNFDNAFQRTLTNLKAAGEELELARINYKGSGNWFDNLVKGVTDAIDRAIETVESMGRWLDDNLLDGRINAMYTLYQILFKFHSNLDQIGGSGSIEEEYNLIGTIGSDIYISQHTGEKKYKIPKTYQDSIASSFTKEDGTNYTYKSYTTTQGLDGKAGSGKRFKVDSSKKLTQDLLDYAINKKEKENKKNLKERFEELGINTSNKLNEEEGFTEQISVNGKTHYVIIY